jgi:hypothetical protein
MPMSTAAVAMAELPCVHRTASGASTVTSEARISRLEARPRMKSVLPPERSRATQHGNMVVAGAPGAGVTTTAPGCTPAHVLTLGRAQQNDEWRLNRRDLQLECVQKLSDTAPTRLSAVAR